MNTILNYKFVDLEISYYIQKEELQTLEYPGCNGELVIEDISIKGIDVMYLLDNQIDEIAESLIKCLEQ